MDHKKTNLDDLYAVRKQMLRRAVANGSLLLSFMIVYALVLVHTQHGKPLDWFSHCIIFLSVLLWAPTLGTFRWLSRYKRLAWVIQETEPLEVAVSRRNWLFTSRLDFRVDKTTSLRSVEGHDPDLGRLLCLPSIFPINFSRAQRKLFEKGSVLAQVYVDPESYSVAAIKTTEGIVFPDAIKKPWHQPP